MQTRELSGSPSLLILYGRAAVPAIPGLSRVPVLGSVSPGGRESESVPELELRLSAVRINADHNAAILQPARAATKCSE